MIGRRSDQVPLFDVGNVFDVKLDPASFHGQLALVAPALFKDEAFATFYAEKMGRPTVPPSLLALTTILQHEAGVSDEEAVNRTAFDLRWAAVLHKEAGEPLCAKSTLQLFRGHLVLHPEVQAIFDASIEEARRAGLLKPKPLRAVIDTKPIRGRGAVQDTFNLLATGIRRLAQALGKHQKRNAKDVLQATGLDRYVEPSLKGSADIDWDDEAAKSALLSQVVADANRLLDLAAGGDGSVDAAAELLRSLLLQDIEVISTPESGEQARVKDGTAKSRVPSATDPEMRHGRKSASKRFNGHKADVVVDEESQTVVAFEVLAGDAPDCAKALDLVKQAEQNTGLNVQETTGDCAYGAASTRDAFAAEGRDLQAKVAQASSPKGMFPKSAFAINVARGTAQCPAGQTTTKLHASADGGKTFEFGACCSDCPLRAQCTTSARGRSLALHRQEAQLQEARAYQRSAQGRQRLRRRVVVEHRLARLGQLGIGQSRYFGRAKTRFQLMMACSVANLRWAWNWEARARADMTTLAAHLPALSALRWLIRPLLERVSHFPVLTTALRNPRLGGRWARRAAA